MLFSNIISGQIKEDEMD